MKYSANGDYIKNPIIEHWSTEGTLYTSDGNVGILTNNPQARLDVNGDIKTSGNIEVKSRNANIVIDGVDYDPVLRLKDKNNSGWTIRNSIPNNNLFSIGKDENKHIFNITNNERIGIMNKDPNYLLDIEDTKPDFILNVNNKNNDGSGIKIKAEKNPLQVVGNGDVEEKHFTIRGNGNIGIGTENPSNKLEVNSFSNDGLVRINNLSDKGSGLVVGSDNYPLRVGSKNDLTGEFLTVKGNGNIGIGNKNPQKKLVVEGTIQADEFIDKNGTIIGGKQNNTLEGSKICMNNGGSGNDYEKICLGLNDFKFINNLKKSIKSSLSGEDKNWEWMDTK